MMPRSITYEAFDAMVDATIGAENDLYFEAECARTWSKKDKATDKVAVKQEQQQRHNSPAGRNTRGADRSPGGQVSFREFRGRNHGRGHCRGRGNSTPRGDHAGSSSGAAPGGCGEKSQGRCSGACHHCGQTGHFIAECWDKQRDGPAATPQQSKKDKA
jgi:hypothetical protein